jgi:RNA polymerase sigma-70 factor (ECF subfamily)
MISDWDCLERARKGDEDAWRLLFKRHNNSLIKFTSLITGSIDVAKDLAQESFIRLLRSRTKHSDGNFKTYLSTIAYRLALKEKKRRQRSHNLDGFEMAAETPTPLEALVEQEQSRHVVRAIHALPEHQRDILVLRFYREHSYDEIARITKLPLGTVKSRIFYAVKTCQEELHKKGVLE